ALPISRRKARAAARRLHGRRARAPRRALAPGACGARAPRGRRPRGTATAALSRALEPSLRGTTPFRTPHRPRTRQVMMNTTNRLATETSPYLLQHANNPVDWYPWGEEALRRAREEDKPIFLSIGYAACHWCHVMERESFENAEVAEVLNRHFVSIKVDREERPDLDDVYMAATVALSGSGGWPM